MVNKRRRLTGEEVGGGREDPGGVRRRATVAMKQKVHILYLKQHCKQK